ncbi:MAG: hypothetical protein HYW63_04375 [Candidatus Levybacteria bacterium]|nr:hypothetical protein [Candidatus Levybacteria bacterium]
MPNPAEVVRNLTLGAIVAMPGGVSADQLRKPDTSSSLPEGRHVLQTNIVFQRFDIANPSVVIPNHSSVLQGGNPGQSLEPSPVASPLVSPEPSASNDPNASPQPSPEASPEPNCPPPVDETELATQDGTGDINFGPDTAEESPLPSLVPTATDIPPDFQLDEEALTDNSTTAQLDPCDALREMKGNKYPEESAALNKIINQKDGSIGSPKPSRLNSEFDRIWSEYKAYFSTYRLALGFSTEPVTKGYIKDSLGILLSKENDKYRRSSIASGTIALIFNIDEQLKQDQTAQDIQEQASADLERLADMVYDYAIRNIPDNKTKLKRQIRIDSNNLFKNWLKTIEESESPEESR